jgi:hypothetical protein
MNTKDLNFAYRVRHALNENLDNLPSATVSRLADSRGMALSRKKKDSPLRVLVKQGVLAGHAGSFFNGRAGWLGRVALLIPLVVVALGVTNLYQREVQQRISETADIDAAVLLDDLPLDAYLDHGFNAFLAKPADKE